MNKKCVNLIPSKRRDAHMRAYRLRAWSVGGVAYTVVLIAACALSYGIWGGDQAAVAAQSERAARQLEETQRAIAKLQPEVNEAQARIDMLKVIDEQPDWSVLLRLLAKSATDQIVLMSCQLDAQPEAIKMGPARPATTQPTSSNHVLVITGFGRSQASVSRFVLRLEEAKLFDQVTLIKTSREAFATGEAFGFRIECSLSGGGGS